MLDIEQAIASSLLRDPALFPLLQALPEHGSLPDQLALFVDTIGFHADSDNSQLKSYSLLLAFLLDKSPFDPCRLALYAQFLSHFDP